MQFTGFKLTKRFCTSLVLVAILSILFFSSTANASAASWSYYSDWSHRTPISVENFGNTAALDNYQIKVTIPHDSNMKSDFSDIRFADSDGETPLSYWLETKTDSVSATFWVKVPAIPGLGKKTVYFYFGNADASSEANGDNTFVFFDDFNDGSINSTKWSWGGAISETGGKLVFDSTYSSSSPISSKQNFARDNISLEYDYRWENKLYSYPDFNMGWTTGVGSYSSFYYSYWNINARTKIRETGTDRGYITPLAINTTYNIRLRMKKAAGNIYERSGDGGNTWSVDKDSTYGAFASQKVGFLFYRGRHLVDNLKVRKWANPEPSVVLGKEEALVAPFADTDPYSIITIAPARPDAYDGWYKTLPAITLTSNKPGATYFQWDAKEDGSWTTYSSTFDFPSALDKVNDGNGIHTLYFYSESNGVKEDIRFFKFKVDSGYNMPNTVGGNCDSCHGEGSGLVGGDHASWYNGTPHDLALNNVDEDGYAAVKPAGSSTRCNRCHYDAMYAGADGKPISPRFLRITNANPDDPDGIRDPDGVVHEVLGNDNTLCNSCHTSGAGAYGGEETYQQTMHSQNGSFASTKAASRWLDADYGQGMCGNCHNPHGVQGTTDYRRKAKNELCENCHDANGPLTDKVSKQGTYKVENNGQVSLDFSPKPPTGEVVRTIALGKVAEDANLGEEDLFFSSTLYLEVSKDLYPQNSIVKVYVNKSPTVTGATFVGDWTNHIWNGDSSKYFNVLGWLNSNKNDDLYVILVLPSGSDYSGTSPVIKAKHIAVYTDNNPSGKKDYFVYQGNEKYNDSAHGNTSNPLTVWPNPIDTGGSIGTGGATAGECINCHNPHGKSDGAGSIYPKMLQNKEEELCFTCHDKTTTSVSGKNIKQSFTASTSVLSKHAVTDADQDKTLNKLECTSCHNPHMNNAQNKVVEPSNPTSLFTGQMVDPVTGNNTFDSITFCSKCHNADLLLADGVRSGLNAVYGYYNFDAAFNKGKSATKSILKVPYDNNWHGNMAAIGLKDTGIWDFNEPGAQDDEKRLVDRDLDYGPMKAPYSRGMGPLSCTNCHDEHGTKNLFHLKEEINGKAVDIQGGSDWLSFCSACHEVPTIRNAHQQNCYGSSCHPQTTANPPAPDFTNMPANAPSDCIKCHNHEGAYYMNKGGL